MEKNDRDLLGLFLHIGHIFSGYKEENIAQFARGMVMGITLTIDCIFDQSVCDLLPERNLRDEIIDFGIKNLLRAYYFSEAIDRSPLKYHIDIINKGNLNGYKEEAKKTMNEFAISSRSFFVDPGNKSKQ